MEQLRNQLEESRRQSADSRAVASKSDVLCKQLHEKLIAQQRAAATENASLQVTAGT